MEEKGTVTSPSSQERRSRHTNAGMKCLKMELFE